MRQQAGSMARRHIPGSGLQKAIALLRRHQRTATPNRHAQWASSSTAGSSSSQAASTMCRRHLLPVLGQGSSITLTRHRHTTLRVFSQQVSVMLEHLNKLGQEVPAALVLAAWLLLPPGERRCTAFSKARKKGTAGTHTPAAAPPLPSCSAPQACCPRAPAPSRWPHPPERS